MREYWLEDILTSISKFEATSSFYISFLNVLMHQGVVYGKGNLTFSLISHQI